MAEWSRIARRIRVPLGFAFAAAYLWLAVPSVPTLIAGACIALPGLALRAYASGYVRKNEQLATTGPYAYTRNPLYLGSLIMAIGFAVAARSLVILGLIVLLFLAVYLPVIRSEEEFLSQTFPEFENYRQQVPRLFFRIPAGKNPSSGFSWGLYKKHREYNAALGMAGVLGALALKMYFLR